MNQIKKIMKEISLLDDSSKKWIMNEISKELGLYKSKKDAKQYLADMMEK